MSVQTLSVTTEWRAGEDQVPRLYLAVTTPQGTSLVGPLKTNEYYTPLANTYLGIIEEPKNKPKVSAKRTKRTSMKLETALAEGLEGRRQTGSGSVASLKGDVRVRDKFRVEQKHTRAGSYRVTQSELSKIRGECTGLEVPLFVIDFLDPQTGKHKDSWTMIETHNFQKLDYKPAYATDIDRGPATSR